MYIYYIYVCTPCVYTVAISKILFNYNYSYKMYNIVRLSLDGYGLIK